MPNTKTIPIAIPLQTESPLAKTNEDAIYTSVPMQTNPNQQDDDHEKEPTPEELRDRAMDELKKNLLFDQKDISIWKLFCHLSRPLDFICMIFACIGSLGGGISMPIIAFLSGDMFSSVGDSGDFQLSNDPAILKIIHDTLNDVMMTQVHRFLYIGVGMFFAHFLNVAFWTFVGLRQVHQLKENYFTVILQQEQGWFDAHNAFEFATKVQAQLEQVELGVGERFGNVLLMISQMISGLVIALTTSWKLSLTMISLSPLIIITIIYLITALKKGIIMGRKTYEKAGGIAEEMLYNIKTVASFANFDFEKDRFNKKIDLVYQFDLGTTIRLGASIGFALFFMNCTFVIAFCYGRVLILDREINSNTGRVFKGGDVITVIFSTVMAIMSIGMVAPNIKIIQESCIATSDYFTLYEREPQIDTSSSVLKPNRDDVKGRIEFKDVMFSYPSDPNKRIILNGINLLFEPGKKVALVGESGCGKSTTVNLIERLYETTGGKVLIDGIDIKDYDINYLRSLIGYVQQEPVLFNRSIADNLTFGREAAIKELGDMDQLIKEACDDAYASEFISLLPDKLNYFVGIKGSKLSGGQKQRLAIARAILCKPKILILDEATSALDNKSEKEVQKALDHISQKNVTTVIIAHRLSTIKNADVIYAIKNGSVLEQGTHKELLDKKGYYAGLVKSQLAQDELESKESNLEMPVKAGRKSSMMHSSSLSNQIPKSQSTKVALKAEDIKVSKLRLFNELRNNKLDIILATFGAAGVGSMQPVMGFMMAKSMNALNSSDMDIVDKDGLFFGLMFLVIAFLNGTLNFFMMWKYNTIGITLAMIFRKKILSKYLTLHMSFFDLNENAPGALLTRLSIDTMQLNSIILSMIGSSVNVSCVVIVGLSMGFSYDWRLSLIVLCFIPIISFSIFIRTSLRKGGNRLGIKSSVEAGSILSECVVNTKTIYSFNFQNKAVSMYLEALSYIKREFTRDSFLNGFFIGIGQFCVFAANATVFYACKCFLIENSITSQNMALAINIIMMCAGGVGNGLAQAGDYRKAALAFKSLYSTIDTISMIDPSKEINASLQSAMNVKGKIEFRDVTFAYPTRPDQIILKKVSFTVQPGQSIALVGYSGCGKSTIIQLLERFYDVEDGKGMILIDDVNIKEYNLLELREKIGLVSQEPILFKRSVMENVRYGRLNATNEEVIKAAAEANIMKFFTEDKMHQVLDQGQSKEKGKGKGNDVGKKEDPVSGGEKQRLAIARAFLKDPKILLLDEATSALDKDSELLVQASLDKLAGGRTSVTIAHRLSTIEKCDIIFVLEAGRIVEQGKHEELMSLQKKYYTLHKYSDAN